MTKQEMREQLRQEVELNWATLRCAMGRRKTDSLPVVDRLYGRLCGLLTAAEALGLLTAGQASKLRTVAWEECCGRQAEDVC